MLHLLFRNIKPFPSKLSYKMFKTCWCLGESVGQNVFGFLWYSKTQPLECFFIQITSSLALIRGNKYVLYLSVL